MTQDQKQLTQDMDNVQDKILETTYRRQETLDTFDKGHLGQRQ